MPEGKKRKPVFVIVLIVILAGIAISVFSAYGYYNDSIYKPMVQSDNTETKEIVINSGVNSQQIIDMLYDEGLIRNKLMLKIYLKYSNLGNRMKAGKYEFNNGMNAMDIINKMVKGDIKKDTIKVTIPEGYEVKDIAAVLEKSGLVDKNEFIETANKGNFDYEFLKSLPERQMRLEGYLFPDTYEFSRNATSEQIITKMLDRFDEVFNDYMRKKASVMNLTIDKVVTMASIIEREAKAAEERPMVAAVFYNRLKIKKRLESCATIQYALGERKENLLYKDLEIDSPYNTYKNNGLPVGPIANPGKASLEAALNPANVNYLYFVLKDATSGTHAFSTNYDQFLRDKQKYYKNLK